MFQLAIAIRDFLKFDNNAKRNDTDIELLYTFHLQTEVKVRLALKNVMNKIKTKNVISYFDYGKLMIALIAIQHNLPDDFDINLDDIENTMLERLNGLGGKINPENILRYQYAEQTSEEKERYELFKQRVTEALSKIHTPLSRFSYKNEQIQELYSYVHEERDRLLERGKLASYFDVNRFINFFMNCTAENIATLHIMFKEMYYRKNDLTEIKDRIEIIQIMNGIKCLESNENFDCIQKMQCKRFVNTLETIIEKSE